MDEHSAPPTTRDAPKTDGDSAAPDADEPLVSTDDPWIGRSIADKYLIVGRLGVGGMAVVYEAENVTIKKRVALKLVDPSQPGGAELAGRFTREIEASARVEHPHVVAAFDGGSIPSSGEAFLVSQLVRGESLHERLDRGPVPWKDAVTIAAQVADGLAAIHAAGFVHRDLTPSNVLLATGRAGIHAFVLDLGIAARIDVKDAPAPVSSFKTMTGVSVGTPGYMSPEQALGKHVDPRSDLYVLGLLVFEMLTAKPVLDGELELAQMVTKQLQNELVLPPVTETGLPPALDAFVRRLLDADVEKRPGSADEVRQTLTAAATVSAAPEPAARPSLADAARETGAQAMAGAKNALEKAAPVVRSGVGSLREGALDLVDRAKRRAMRPRDWAITAGTLGGVLLSCVVLGYACSGDEPTVVAETDASAPAPAEPPPTPAVPDEPTTITLTVIENDLLNGRTRAIRENAATTVLTAEDGAYDRYARLVAVLTLARTCDARLTQIEALGALGDVRAIPALERIDEAPETGCGRRSREDCHACARDAVETALATLRASGSVAP